MVCWCGGGGVPRDKPFHAPRTEQPCLPRVILTRFAGRTQAGEGIRAECGGLSDGRYAGVSRLQLVGVLVPRGVAAEEQRAVCQPSPAVSGGHRFQTNSVQRAGKRTALERRSRRTGPTTVKHIAQTGIAGYCSGPDAGHRTIRDDLVDLVPQVRRNRRALALVVLDGVTGSRLLVGYDPRNLLRIGHGSSVDGHALRSAATAAGCCLPAVCTATAAAAAVDVTAALHTGTRAAAADLVVEGRVALLCHIGTGCLRRSIGLLLAARVRNCDARHA